MPGASTTLQLLLFPLYKNAPPSLTLSTTKYIYIYIKINKQINKYINIYIYTYKPLDLGPKPRLQNIKNLPESYLRALARVLTKFSRVSGLGF